ncbi:MAG: D-glycero-beta-D-manno-heptose-7-phosphate kinase [Deltaproteobacteria bacterium]|nr:D-glycero-beta-D-manno-heptose-7-phosphate kinase [Deltaproteobacteria bacterium]
MIKEVNVSENDSLKKFIDKFDQTRILVIGDIMMDEYIWGEVSRISPEAPIPVVEVKEETKMLGGAANVMHNIISLGGKSILCGVIGNDDTGKQILERIHDLGVVTDGIIIEANRLTSIKTRVVARNQQVVRVDRETRKEINQSSIEKFLGFIKNKINGIDAIIIADYGKGVISERLMKGLKKLISGNNIFLAVDPKTENFRYYKGIDIITPNHHEAGAFCRTVIDDDESLIKAGKTIIEKVRCKAVLITQGKDGMTLFGKDGEICHIPTVGRKVFDVSGAGDTVISTLCMGLAAGMDLESAAVIANFAAGIVVGEVGTSTVRAEELKKAINGRRF